MSALNRPENFAGRVKHAASVISSGRRTNRSFDNCFENYDGDAVAAALVRRARKNPSTQLAANLWRYVSRERAEAAAAKLEGQDLEGAAAAMRAKAAADWAASMEAARAAQ